MKVSDIMTRDVRVVRPEETVREATVKMRDEDVGALPVCDGKKLIGVITDRDVAVRSIASGDDPNKAVVRDVMTPEVVWAFEDDDVEDVARKMQERQVRRVAIVNRDKDLIGMVALADIATQVGGATKAKTVEKVSQPAHSESAGRH